MNVSAAVCVVMAVFLFCLAIYEAATNRLARSDLFLIAGSAFLVAAIVLMR